MESLPRFAQSWPVLTDQQPGYSRSQAEGFRGLPVCLSTQGAEASYLGKGKKAVVTLTHTVKTNGREGTP